MYRRSPEPIASTHLHTSGPDLDQALVKVDTSGAVKAAGNSLRCCATITVDRAVAWCSHPVASADQRAASRTTGKEALMTYANQPDTMSAGDTTRRSGRTEQGETRERSTVSPGALARVLAHLRGRARSHPDSPATGLDPMSDSEWRACIVVLRRRGSRITESIVIKGDRVANEIGYSLVHEPPLLGPRPWPGGNPPTALRPVRRWSVDRSPGLAI